MINKVERLLLTEYYENRKKEILSEFKNEKGELKIY